MTEAGISIVLCCYNSARRLPQTLGFLMAQQITEELNWEIIIVDNASSDNTSEVALKVWGNCDLKIPFNVVEQPIPGLSHAREKGIETARFSFILFCDDDNWLDPTYVSKAYSIMMSDKTIGVLGGFVIAAPEPPVPAWLNDRISHYSVGSQEEFARHHWVYGAGSVCRRQILTELQKLNWKQITSDRIGDLYLYGGDNELCYMVNLMGFDIRYDEALTIQHFLPQERLNILYIEKSAYGAYFSEFFLYPYYYYLSKRFTQKTTIGFVTYTCFYLLRKMSIATKKCIFLIFKSSTNYKKNMVKLEIKAMFKSLVGFYKIIKHFQLIHEIINHAKMTSKVYLK